MKTRYIKPIVDTFVLDPEVVLGKIQSNGPSGIKATLDDKVCDEFASNSSDLWEEEDEESSHYSGVWK